MSKHSVGCSRVVACSSAEAELYALFEGAKETIGIQHAVAHVYGCQAEELPISRFAYGFDGSPKCHRDVRVVEKIKTYRYLDLFFSKMPDLQGSDFHQLCPRYRKFVPT